jgi:hypothetical protein
MLPFSGMLEEKMANISELLPDLWWIDEGPYSAK